jgi:phosphopantothenoylcysteine synthetase/decarboxylase
MTAGPAVTVVVCGAGPASEVGELVAQAQRRGWTVNLVATPAGRAFLDVPVLEQQTGSPVRSEYRTADEARARSLPEARAVVVAPATYNTTCKLALGISDTYALGVLAEAVGMGLPVAVLPFVNAALAARKPFTAAVASLREEGVRVLLGPGEWVPHPPRTGGEHLATFPWARALDAAGVTTH